MVFTHNLIQFVETFKCKNEAKTMKTEKRERKRRKNEKPNLAAAEL